MAPTTFTIKEAAARAGVSPDTIRHYERIGVVPRAPRTAGGYRRYSDASLAQLMVVRNAVRLGFPLRDLAAFFNARAQGRPPCRSVRAAGERLLDGLDRQLAELAHARVELRRMLDQWDDALARTPDGTAAHLLSSLAGLPLTPAVRKKRVRASA
jgi:DNA-binding transcriptional MerR regulator